MAGAYLVQTPQPSGNLVRGAALGTVEDMMDDKNKRTDDETPKDDSSTGGGAIKDEAWSKVDLHKDKKTPGADLPSDIEPHEG